MAALRVRTTGAGELPLNHQVGRAQGGALFDMNAETTSVGLLPRLIGGSISPRSGVMFRIRKSSFLITAVRVWDDGEKHFMCGGFEDMQSEWFAFQAKRFGRGRLFPCDAEDVAFEGIRLVVAEKSDLIIAPRQIRCGQYQAEGDLIGAL